MTAVRALRFASALTLLALALMVWSLLDPRPVPVMVAMSAGQALGTLSLLIYLAVVLLDLRRNLGGAAGPGSPRGEAVQELVEGAPGAADRRGGADHLEEVR